MQSLINCRQLLRFSAFVPTLLILPQNFCQSLYRTYVMVNIQIRVCPSVQCGPLFQRGALRRSQNKGRVAPRNSSYITKDKDDFRNMTIFYSRVRVRTVATPCFCTCVSLVYNSSILPNNWAEQCVSTSVCLQICMCTLQLGDLYLT